MPFFGNFCSKLGCFCCAENRISQVRQSQQRKIYRGGTVKDGSWVLRKWAGRERERVKWAAFLAPETGPVSFTLLTQATGSYTSFPSVMRRLTLPRGHRCRRWDGVPGCDSLCFSPIHFWGSDKTYFQQINLEIGIIEPYIMCTNCVQHCSRCAKCESVKPTSSGIMRSCNRSLTSEQSLTVVDSVAPRFGNEITILATFSLNTQKIGMESA